MLSKYHTRLLKKIAKKKIVRTEKRHRDLDYLYSQGYIEITTVDKPDDYFAQPYLTEKGKARLKVERDNFISAKIPVAISLIALVKSFMPELLGLWEQVWQLLTK